MTPEDSLELDLGASASQVTDNTGPHCEVSGHYCHPTGQTPTLRLNIIYSDVPTDSLQLDLHLEGSAPITLLVRDESRSTKSSGARGSNCARTATVKQVSWGSTSSLANNDQVSQVRSFLHFQSK